MKKLNYFLLGAAALMMTACSQDEVNLGGASDGNLQITVKLPAEGLGTRSFGDGYTATNLLMYVYDADTKAYVTQQTATFPSNALQTTVSFNLVNGKSYYIAFLAESANAASVYSVNTADATLTVNYGAMTAYNTDAYDCFYQVYSTGVIGTDTPESSVTLYRPVAQVNWGTSDLTNPAVTQAYGTNITSSVTTTAYTTFDLLGENSEGKVVGTVDETQTEEITLGYLAPPTGETFPVSGYDYLSMQYLLVPRESSLLDLTLNISNNDGSTVLSKVEVSSAPVQANYRTNIYGSLLTNTTTVSVLKDPTWGTPDNSVQFTWDGTSLTYPAVDSEGNYNVTRASDLAGLAAMVNGTDGQTATDFSGQTIVLAADFDMGGNDFEQIGAATRSGASAMGTKAFNGVFDGQGHTISNVKISGNNVAANVVGFIAYMNNPAASVKNVNFDNLVIDAPNCEQAGVVGMVTGGATVENVKVNSGSISSKEAAGGIVGRVTLNGTVKGCENHATISSGTNAGGIVGAAYYTNNNGTMTIADCDNYGTINGSYAAAGIAGLCSADVSGCNNYGTVNANAASVGGIVGEMKSAGSVKNCTNNGAVKVTNAASGVYGAGGIVGWIRYDNSASYSRQNVIEVSGCTNNGAVTGNTGVGGIVGMWYMCGICKDNFNYAPSVTADGIFAAGVVGGQQWTEAYPSGVAANQKLTVTGNTSTTTIDNIKAAGSKALIIYVNSPENVTVSGNSPANN